MLSKSDVNGKFSCGLLGGSILFPSGHEGTFIENKQGFLELSRDYVLFLWKPDPKDANFMIIDAYGLNDGHVSSVFAIAHENQFAGMDANEFLKKVKLAISENVNVM